MGRSGAIIALLLTGSMAQAECRPETLEVRGQGGVTRFSVEVADSDAERSQGLMFRQSMPASAGMLFVYDNPRRASFWMENTLIPLDMVFADETGTVTHIHENAIPRDRTPIDGGTGVQFVLEINGGLARRLGITEGAALRHPAIDPAVAAFPCATE
jgi:uncharacterized protein